MLSNQFQPSPCVSLRKIDATKKQARNEMTDLVRKRLILNRPKSFSGAFRAVRVAPSLFHLTFDLCDCHFLGRMCHVKWSEVQPVLGARETAFLQQPVIKRCGWKRCNLSKH